jgi:hypothetical protein
MSGLPVRYTLDFTQPQKIPQIITEITDKTK